MPRHQPTITIGGRVFPCDFTPQGDPVVLDGLSITWGREGLYEPTESAQLTAHLIDPDGSWGSSTSLFGSIVVVSTDLGTLYRGRVDGVSLHPIDLGEDPATLVRAAWEVEITASDVIADLGKLVVPGPEGGPNPPYYRAYYGPGYWYQGSSETRRAAIQSRMLANGIRTTVETRDFAQAVPPGKPAWYYYYTEPTITADADLYTMVRTVQARGDEIFHTNYIPGPDTLAAGRWPAAAGLILTYASPVIGLATDPAAGAAFLVPCESVGISDNAAVRAAILNNIASVEVDQYTQTIYWQSNPDGTDTQGQIYSWPRASVSSPVVTVSGGQGRYRSPALIGYSNSWITPPNPVSYPVGESGAEYTARMAPLIAALNGRLMPPILSFDLENETYPADVQAALLATWTPGKSWAFPGSKYESLVGWGPFFQLIGGELTYEQGWTVDAIFAPARTTGTGTLSISQLVTTDPPLLNQYTDTISLSTLGVVTQGV